MYLLFKFCCWKLEQEPVAKLNDNNKEDVME